MSYTLTGNVAGRFTTNAEFRAWGSWISDGLANCGIIKTGDPGPINWASVEMPAVVSAWQGYEIYRFDDALQTTSPVFFKIEYGSGAAGNTVPGLRWTVGTSSNAVGLSNGTIMGFVAKDQSLANGWTITSSAGAFANNTLVAYLSGGNNWFIIALGVRGTGSTASYTHLISIERTVDANGAVTGDGLLIAYKAAAGSVGPGQITWSPILGTISHAAATADGFGMLTPERGGGVTGANTAVYPIFHDWGGGVFLNPGLNLFGYFHSEFTAGTANTFDVYGASHTYMPLGNTAVYGIGGRCGNNSICLMMRYE